MKIIETKPKTNNMSHDTWKSLYKQLGNIANPQLSALRDFLEAPFQMVFTSEEAQQQKAYNQYMSVLQLKLDGMTKEPSSIEKTMNRAQLFLCNNPLWTIGLRPDAIKLISSTYRTLKDIGKPDVIAPIITEAITEYGVIDMQRRRKILNENNIA